MLRCDGRVTVLGACAWPKIRPLFASCSSAGAGTASGPFCQGIGVRPPGVDGDQDQVGGAAAAAVLRSRSAAAESQAGTRILTSGT